MKTKEEIVKILTDTLCYAYCDNCGNDMDEDLCGDCHRKYQNWKLSRDAAGKIADKIVNNEHINQRLEDAENVRK